MQPFQRDLQPQIQESHRTTHTWTTTRCRTPMENRSDDETSAAAPAAHTRYLSSPAAATLHGETQGFVLRLPPRHKPHATFMQPLKCVLQHHVANLHVSTHGNTRWQQSCSHSNTICNHRCKKRVEAHIAEHQGRTHSTMKRAQPHKPHTRGTFHRRLKPLSTEKHKVSFSGFLPNTSPMQHSCSHDNAFWSSTGKPACIN